MKRSCLPRVLILFLLSGVTVFAQITGGIRGTVSDPSGATLSKASVTITSLETHQARTQVVNNAGEFNFDLLSVGNYEVKAEAVGFTASSTRVLVKTGEISSVPFKLEVGAVTETVEVSGLASQIDTENAQVQVSVTGANVQELPVSRNPNLIALTSPGMAPVSQNNPYLGSGSFNSNGGRGRGNNITVDGITATDVSVTGTGGPLGPLNFAAIKEVKVISNNFNAEYGRNSSAQVIYITKGGTNELHGEAYEFLYNNKLNARSFFDTSGHADIVRTNTFGYSVGGPLFIPKVINGRNRFFWYTDYEGFKNRGVGQARIAKVPTDAMAGQVTDPTSVALLKQYQIPTAASGQLSANAPSTTNSHELSFRGDVVISQKDSLWARYAFFDSVANSSGLTFVSSNLPYFGASSQNQPRQATLSETHLFGATAVNEFRFGFGQSKPAFPIQTPYPLGPQITISDGSVTSFGVSNILPQGREQRTYQYTDNFTINRGSHNIKMGFEWYHLEADSYFDSNIRGSLTFPTWAAFAAGQPSAWSQNFGNSVRANRVENAFAFAQDDWKVSRKLTLNLGLRLEYAGGPTEADGRISNLNLDNHAAFGAAGSGPLGLLETGKPSFNSNRNWGPRFGFAYQPFGDDKTVIRGGYGFTYDFVFLNPITNQRFLPPLIYSGSLSTGNFTGGNTYANLFAGTADIQKSLAASVGQLSTSLKNFGAISPAIQQNLANPQVQQRMLGIERELPHNMVLKVAWVGSKGTYLPRTRPINLTAAPPAAATSFADQTARQSLFSSTVSGLNGNASSYSNRYDPRYNAVNYVESSANSLYNSLQVELEKRFSRNYFVHVAYTWAHSIDDNSDVLGVLVNDSAAQQDPNNNANNRASSQFDLRHTLTISHTWEMPFFRTSSSRLLRAGLGGWSFSGISSYHSGFPVTIYAGNTVIGSDPVYYITGNNSVDRPNIAGPITNFAPKPAGSAGAPSGVSTVNGVGISTYAQSLGLSQPLLGNYGNMGRNLLRLNGQLNFDWNLYKNFRSTEGTNVQLRSEFYNIFNAHSFQSMASSTITSPSFGQYTTVGQNSRTIQVGARFVF
jgi:hypothetical protein